MTTSLTPSIIPPGAGASEISRNDFQSRLAGVGNLGGKNITPAQKEKKLREACEGFESIFIQKMWEEMRKTLTKSTLLHGREEQFWQGMYDQELAKKMTSAGGIGLADMMYAQLSRNLASASNTTATSAVGAGQSAFRPEAAPMFPTGGPKAEHGDAESIVVAGSGQNKGQKPAASVYEDLPSTGEEENLEIGPVAIPVPSIPSQVEANRKQQSVPSSPQVERHKVVRTTNVRSSRNSALDLARMAQFEAGTKLGTNTVRPSLQQVMGMPQAQRQPVLSTESAGVNNVPIPPLTGDIFTQTNEGLSPVVQTAMQSEGRQSVLTSQARDIGAQASDAATLAPPAAQKMRYTTNIPSKGKSAKQDLIRMLNVDADGPNSKAGAGIAAYHAQMETVSAGATAPASGQTPILTGPLPTDLAGQAANPIPAPTTPAAPAVNAQQTGQPVQNMPNPEPRMGAQVWAHKSSRAESFSSSGIPPLTGTNMNSL